jgi:predicted amidophosphoribosyltransferase
MKKCRNLKCLTGAFSHEAKANYCWLCGTDLMEHPEQQCECGNRIGASDKFCPNCGKEVGK